MVQFFWLTLYINTDMPNIMYNITSWMVHNFSVIYIERQSSYFVHAATKKFYVLPQSKVEKSARKFFNICKTVKRDILTMKSTADSAHVTTEQMHRRHTDQMSRQVTQR